MFPYNKIKALHSFKPVRVLTGKDLYNRYGQRVPVDKSNFSGYSRNPLERMDYAMNEVNYKVTQQDYEEYARQQSNQADESSKDTDSKTE